MLPILKPQHRLKDVSTALVRILSFAFVLTNSTSFSAETSTRPAPNATAASAQTAAPLAPAPAPQVTPPLPAVRSVSLVTPKTETWPDQIEAHGNIMPWQETRIGTEIGGLRLVSILANVGDIVKKGQVLARLNPTPVEADLEAATAQLMETQAAQAQAVATLDRAKRLAPSGGVSQQELTQYETQKRTAEARFNAARAQVKTQQLRLDSATLVAPDDGVISSRSVAEGAIVQAGSELFRLIRQGRLEWRAEVKGETLLRLSVGQEVTVKSPLGPDVKGHVRQVSPTIDLTTRNGLAYVDLPLDTNLKAGLFVSGTLAMNKRKALILPSRAVQHEGEARRVFKVNADSKLEAVEVQIGRVRDGHEEITSGVDGDVQVVATAVELLRAGDSVMVNQANGEAGSAQASSKPE